MATARAIRVSADAVEWGGRRIGWEALARARERGIVSFGSCSFREPVDELHAIATN